MTTPFQLTQSFVPTQIPGCQLWFDAADQTTLTYSSGTSVSQWQDKSRCFLLAQSATNLAVVFCFFDLCLMIAWMFRLIDDFDFFFEKNRNSFVPLMIDE
jgi:hypothetical protein